MKTLASDGRDMRRLEDWQSFLVGNRAAALINAGREGLKHVISRSSRWPEWIVAG